MFVLFDIVSSYMILSTCPEIMRNADFFSLELLLRLFF